MKKKRDILFLCQVFYPEYISSAQLPYDTVLRKYEGVISWLRTADVPTFGICLGLQLICATFGVA